MTAEDPWPWDLEGEIECFETVALTDPTFDRHWHVDPEHADEFERALRVPYRRERTVTLDATGAPCVVFHRLEHWLN